MSELPFQKFIDLVAFDQATNKLENELKQFEQSVHQSTTQINQIISDVALVKQKLAASKKNVDAKEHEMKELDEKQKEKQRILDRVVNQRECQSIYQEIEVLKKTQHDYEEELLSAWHLFEVAQKEFAIKKQDSEKSIQGLEDKLLLYAQQQEVIKQSLEEQQKQRAAKEVGIPEEWLEKYTMMSRTVKNPVVPVVNGACSACFYNLPLPDMGRLRKHAMLQCKDCYRFLYME